MSSGTAQSQINSSQQQQQQQQQQPQQQLQQQSSLLRPEHVRSLLHLTPEERVKYERGLRQLWETIQSNSPDTQNHQTASVKLLHVSNKLKEDFRKWKQAQTQGQNQMPQQNTKPANQGHGLQGQAAQTSGSQAQQPQPQPSASQGQQHQIPPRFLQQAQQMPVVLPPKVAQGTPEADRYIAEARNRYAQNSYQRAWGVDRLKQINSMMEQRKAQGQDLPADLLVQKAAAEQAVTKATTFLEEFRRQQQHWQAQRSQLQDGEHAGGGNGSSGDPISAQGNVQHQAQENRPPIPGGHTLNSALETARNQASARERASASPGAAGQSQAGQAHSSQAPANPTLQTSAAHLQQQYQYQQQQQSAPSFNLNRPPPSRQQSQQQQPPFQTGAHPRSQNVTSSQSGAPQGPPAPLSHSAAVSAAANAYSDQRSTPQPAMGQAHPQIGNRDQTSHANRFQIPKQLNVSAPHPVNIGPSRPTMGGPNNGAPGMMGEPVIPKLPQFVLEGDGDRVLSKKKLDELVRQVTGGVEGAAGESLAPEVEEAMFLLADEFVDNVVTQACRMAKARESNSLELRDIQHVLERSYNIRVPGYASDEIRTVRKLQPAPGWTQKLNAVQAAKVMGGKSE